MYGPYQNFCKICLSVFFHHTENACRNCSVHNVVIDKVVLVWDGSPFQIETTCHAWVPASCMSLNPSWFLWIFVYLLIKTPALINAIFTPISQAASCFFKGTKSLSHKMPSSEHCVLAFNGCVLQHSIFLILLHLDSHHNAQWKHAAYSTWMTLKLNLVAEQYLNYSVAEQYLNYPCLYLLA